jgi:hypothetical protein
MFERATVLLRHQCPAGDHYDWMIEDPRAEAGRGMLLTWRTAQPTSRWSELGRLELEPIATHRRDYLTFEGALTGGRGQVRRIDEGFVTGIEWTAAGGRLEIRMRGFAGQVDLACTEEGRWELRVVRPTDRGGP